MTTLDDPILKAAINRLSAIHNQRKAEIDAMLAVCPLAITCNVHGTDRALSRELSAKERKPIYAPCPQCRQEQMDSDQRERLHRAGVPRNLCTATFDNWNAESETEEAHLECVRDFARVRRGFLVMLGELGTGKSHLAAATTRQFRNPMFIKQSELLRRLRDTYRDKAARDPVDQAQEADLFVLDEMGLSGGGRDELPMLHDILDHRHNEHLPTILTGNITLEAMQPIIGERMADRLRESAFAVLMFGGGSRRREAREKYFAAA